MTSDSTRLPEGPPPKAARFTFLLPADLKRELEAYCDRQGQPVSELLRQMVEDCVASGRTGREG